MRLRRQFQLIPTWNCAPVIPEYAADDPTRKAKVPQVGFRQVGPEEFGSGRGPHV
jgi:hypothetical protein